MISGIPLPRFAFTTVIALFILLTAGEIRADIFKWVDDQGTLHFTDDPSSIPTSKRERSAPYIKDKSEKEAASEQATATAPPPQTNASRRALPPASVSPETGENGTETLQREIEQLRAKISAKESLIRAVDEKRSLAMNPMRNRIVSAADLDLYQKYQSELPSDRERLFQLENQQRGSR